MATEKVTYELSLRDLMTKGLGDINSKLAGMEKKLTDVDKTTKKATTGMGSAFSGLGTIIAGLGLGAFAKDTLFLAAKFQSLSNSIKFASDSAVQGDLSLQWISDLSKKYGLEIEGVAQGFKTFQGAMMKTKFTSAQTRRMFEQVNQGVVAMGLSAEDAKGTYLALGQIMGKGKVQAEELRGQIGERIPGAFAIAARAMNMTTSQLDKFMADGKLMAEDFLPKFAAEMEKTFSQGATDGVNSLQASINRLSNAWTELRLAMAESDGGIMQKTLDGWAKALDWIADKFRSIDQMSARASNENTINILSNVEGLLKKQLEDMKAKGLGKEEIEAGLRGTQATTQVNWTKNIKAMEAQLEQMRLANIQKETSGLWAVDMQTATERSTTDAMYRSNEEFKALYDRLTSTKKALQGLGGVADKTISSMFQTDKIVTPAGGKSDKLKSEIDTISGKAPSNMYINIDALIKDVTMYPYEAGKAGANDLNNFLTQLENALITVVSDVNRIKN